MSKNNTFLLIGWNLVLTALVAWGLMRSPSTTEPELAGSAIDSTLGDIGIKPIVRDTAALKEARIAYFRMDSLRGKYKLIKDKDAAYKAAVNKLEHGLQGEQARARARYQELMEKDHTYSTQAEVAKDEEELQGLMASLQNKQAVGEQQIAEMEADMLTEISKELDEYLKVYNDVAGFDYIFSIQGNGQIWTGNTTLDITDQLVEGLNARYAARKGK
ncbi:MAG TPA: OmpH family outer membrane protein [Flavobacteriales bacterium]|nr:OmpH family outer membrane protein [Flavobacteriales bacterium]